MRLLAIDTETTGLDVVSDRILSFGSAIFDTDGNKIIFQSETLLWHDDYPVITESAFSAHGMRAKDIQEFGQDPGEFYFELANFIEKTKCEYLMAHNGHGFDFPMLINNAEAYQSGLRSFFPKMKKIDTMLDLPIPGKSLQYMAADHGFLNPFPHSALSDVRTMIKIFENYPLEDILRRANSPELTVRANVSFADKDKARRAQFRWDPASQKWLKKIKACDLEELVKKSDFEILEEKQ